MVLVGWPEVPWLSWTTRVRKGWLVVGPYLVEGHWIPRRAVLAAAPGPTRKIELNTALALAIVTALALAIVGTLASAIGYSLVPIIDGCNFVDRRHPPVRVVAERRVLAVIAGLLPNHIADAALPRPHQSCLQVRPCRLQFRLFQLDFYQWLFLLADSDDGIVPSPPVVRYGINLVVAQRDRNSRRVVRLEAPLRVTVELPRAIKIGSDQQLRLYQFF